MKNIANLNEQIIRVHNPPDRHWVTKACRMRLNHPTRHFGKSPTECFLHRGLSLLRQFWNISTQTISSKSSKPGLRASKSGWKPRLETFICKEIADDQSFTKKIQNQTTKRRIDNTIETLPSWPHIQQSSSSNPRNPIDFAMSLAYTAQRIIPSWAFFF